MTRLLLKCLLGAVIVLSWSTVASATCVERTADDVAQVPVERRGQLYQLVVGDEDVAVLEAKGFREATCSGKLADKQNQLDYRNSLCEFVANANFLVQEQVEKALGAPPALLCSSAQKLLGAWSGEPGPAPLQKSQSRTRIVDGEGVSLNASADVSGEEGQ